MKTGTVKIKTRHEECVGGKHGSSKGTMIAKGWHSNYADFEAEGLKCSVTFCGDKVIIEVGKSHRYEVSLYEVIAELINEAKADQ